MSEGPWVFGTFSALAGAPATPAARPQRPAARRESPSTVEADRTPSSVPSDPPNEPSDPASPSPAEPAPAPAPAPMLGCGGPSARAPLARADAESTAALLKAVADPARLQLLSLVRAGAAGEACVCDLTAAVGLSQPTVSHHLKVLVKAGLLERERRGVWAWYRLVPARLADVAAIFA